MRGSTDARLLGSRVRIPPGAWISLVCCVLLGRGLCDGLITRSVYCYRVCSACVRGTSQRSPKEARVVEPREIACNSSAYGNGFGNL